MNHSFIQWPLIGLCLAGVVVVVLALYAAGRKRSNMKWMLWILLGPVLVAGFLALLLTPARLAPSRTAPFIVSAESTSSDGTIERNDEIVITQAHRVSTADAYQPVSPLDDVSTLLADQPPWIKTVFAGGALALLITLAYLFLDAGRRGGYAWPIRITATIVFAGLCLCLWEIGPLM